MKRIVRCAEITGSATLAEMTVTKSLLVVLALSLSACAQLKPRPELPMELATPVASTTSLDRAFLPAEESHAGQSAFRLLIEGTEAFVARMHSARMAERTLDVQKIGRASCRERV